MNKAVLVLSVILAGATAPGATTTLPPAPLNFHVVGTLTIPVEPQSQTVMAGLSATFNVLATGDNPLSYKWTFNGANVGSNSNVYTRSSCQLTDNGGLVQVTVSDPGNSVKSTAATLSVTGSGTLYYVSPNGSSGNTGRSTSSPWDIGTAIANAGPGNTIIMMDGNYPAVSLSSPSTQSRLTFKALNKWKPVITGASGVGFYIDYGISNVVVEGLQVGNAGDCAFKSFGPYGVVRDCWFHHSGSQGILYQFQPGVLIESCLLEYNGLSDPSPCHGIYMNGTNCVVRNNVLRYNRNWGAQIYGSHTGEDACMECKVYNNLCYGNMSGLTVWANGNFTNHVFGNTICNNSNYGFVANYGTITFTNNIILGNPGGNVVQGSDGASTWYADYNLSTADLSPYNGPHDVVSSTANFVNTGNGLYWLVSGSPARGKALPRLCGPTDFFGNTQSSVSDIGAFQYGATLAGDTRVLDPSGTNPDYWSPP